MNPLEQLPKHIIRLLADSLHSIFKQLSADLPAHASRRLARSFRSFSEWILKYYEVAVKEAESDPDPEQTLRRIDAVFSGILRSIQNNCSRLIHPPGVEDFPQELALWAKEWLCQYGNYGRQTTSVALLPHWPFCPEIIRFPNPLRKIQTEIEERLLLERQRGFDDELARHPEHFLLFTFPRAEGRNILFHPMLLHEFGHAIDWNHRLMENVRDCVELSLQDFVRYKKVIERWIREFLADLLATRLGGPCFALALHQVSIIAKVLDHNSDTHPASRTRLALILEHLEMESLDYFKGDDRSRTGVLLRDWKKHLEGVLPCEAGAGGAGYDLVRGALLNDTVRSCLHDTIEDYCVRNGHKSFDRTCYDTVVPGIVTQLRAGLPPAGAFSGASVLPSVFNGAWELVLEGDKLFDDFEAIKPHEQVGALKAMSGLAFKGIEAAQVERHWRERGGSPFASEEAPEITTSDVRDLPKRAVLTKSEIRLGLKEKKGFEITPILESTQIGDGSVDLRLGSHFIVTKAADLPSINPEKLNRQEIRGFQQHVSKSFGETFVLHPRRLVLGGTFEYIALPDDLAALVLSRSSYGRIGLIVATATYVHPGWKGCLTLELSNAADIPLELRCGASIAQLVVFRADRLPSSGPKEFPIDRDPFPTFPTFSLLAEDPDWKRLESLAHGLEHL